MNNMRISSIDAFKALVELGRMIAEEKADVLPTNSIIDIAPVLKYWEEGQYSAGNLVRYNDQPWRCLQTHDSRGNPNWCPGVAPSIWGAYHGTTADHALPWQAPTGAHDCYNSGEYMIWTDGDIYMCNADGTVHDPEVLSTAWTKVGEIQIMPPIPETETGEDTPTETEHPVWSQPTGAHDAYNKGDIVNYNGVLYRSLIDGNTYSPEAYSAGWEIYTE